MATSMEEGGTTAGAGEVAREDTAADIKADTAGDMAVANMTDIDTSD